MSQQHRFNKKQKNQNNHNNNVIDMDHYVTRKKQVVLVPRNLNQETYIEKLLNPTHASKHIIKGLLTDQGDPISV
jgi:hypothetical protein